MIGSIKYQVKYLKKKNFIYLILYQQKKDEPRRDLKKS